MAVFHTGALFSSMEEARDLINRSVLDKGESYKVLCSNKKSHVLCCRGPRGEEGCKFYISATLIKSQDIRIGTVRPHSCNPRMHYKFKQLQSTWYLMPHHRTSVNANRDITTAQIKANEKERFGNDIGYMAAYRTREKLRQEIESKEEDDFPRIWTYGQLLHDQTTSHQSNYFELDQEKFGLRDDQPETHRFYRCFTAPAATRVAFQHLRPFIAMDACHTMSRYRLTLMIATMIDGNGQIIPMCWALVPKESYSHWVWFLKHMTEAFNTEHFEISQLERLVIMSDREKGLAKAVDEVLPCAKHSHCCQHIAANIQSRFGVACRKLFWTAAYARTKAEFDAAIDGVLKESRPAAAYLRSIPAETWATYAFPLPRYGHITSNIVESLNGTWKHLRHLPPLRLLAGIWSSVMETFCERRERLQTSIDLTSQAKAGFESRYEKSRRYRAIPADDTIVQVIDEDGKDWIVDLESRCCTCLMFQEHGGPCGHAIIAARARKVDPYALFSNAFTFLTYRYTYQASMRPVSIRGLEPGPGCLPPLISRKRGRPKTTRVRKRERHQKKKTKCSNSWCRQEGHNRRSCRTTNNNGVLALGEESNPVEEEGEEEAIVVELPI